MLLKPELTAFIQSFNTPNPKILEVISFVHSVICNRPSNKRPWETSHYAMLLVKREKYNTIMIKNDTKSLPPD